jgi:hypothetical protein
LQQFCSFEIVLGSGAVPALAVLKTTLSKTNHKADKSHLVCIVNSPEAGHSGPWLASGPPDCAHPAHSLQTPELAF